MTNVDQRESDRLAIRAYGKRSAGAGFWLARIVLLVAGVLLAVLTALKLPDESGGSPVLGLVGAFVIVILAVAPLILESLHRARLKRVADRSPDAFVMPIAITKEMPAQATEIAHALSQRPPALTAHRHALFAADAVDVRIVSGRRPAPSSSYRGLRCGQSR